MAVARVFQSGNSQAVRLPKEFRFSSDKVEIFRRGEEVVLVERKTDMRRAIELLQQLSDAFEEPPPDLPPQEREDL